MDYRKIVSLMQNSFAHETRGKHLLIEYTGIETKILNALQLIEVVVENVKKSGATVLDYKVHKFSPQGVSGIILLSESHASFHTYPEYNYMSLDIYTCGDYVFPDRSEKAIRETLKPKAHFVRSIERGVYSSDDRMYKSEVVEGYS